MPNLANKNPHMRDKHISFQQEGHVYTVDGDTSYTSTTTWVHSHFRRFDADKVIDKMMRSKNWAQSKYFGQTPEQIKAGWAENGRQASSAGTKMHEDIEDFYNGIRVDNDSTEYRYFKNFHRDHSHLEPHRTEWYIWEKSLKLCGSIDMTYKNEDGTLRIYDWKRCRSIKLRNDWGEKGLSEPISHIDDCNFYHYALQLNVYKALLERGYGVKVSELAIVCLHPNNQDYQKILIPDLSEEVEGLFLQRREELRLEEGEEVEEGEEIEVEERSMDGVSYLVSEDGTIYSEDGKVVGKWPPL